MAKIPQVKKNARMADSLRFRSARLVMVFSDSLFLSLLADPAALRILEGRGEAAAPPQPKAAELF
jgi:hypothetical protein